MVTTFDPMRPLPPMTTIFILFFVSDASSFIMIASSLRCWLCVNWTLGQLHLAPRPRSHRGLRNDFARGAEYQGFAKDASPNAAGNRCASTSYSFVLDITKVSLCAFI